MDKSQRDRGRILTLSGLKKLNEAIALWKDENNLRGTLVEIEAESGVGSDTISKIRQGRVGADISKIQQLFTAFNLKLEEADHRSSKEPAPLAIQTPQIPTGEAEPGIPDGQVTIESTFYIERPPIEERCFQTILQPSALIRIKAPRRFGKTSLMARILASASQANYRTVSLSFQLVDKHIFSNLDQFLKWFCAYVGRELNLPNQLNDYWDDIFGSKVNCKDYFEKYLLTQIDVPLVLGLDELDRVFQYPDIAEDFLGLLRAWHEESKRRAIWQKLRLIMVHSTEVYIPMNINQSPFNVGLPIELPEFTPDQILELARRHDLDWSNIEVEQIMSLIGGHPYLIRVALYHIARGDLTLSQWQETAISEAGIYSDHLRRHLWNLEQNPELLTAIQQVINHPAGYQLASIVAFKLDSMGLVRLQGNIVTPRCELYRQYLQLHFQ